MAMMQESPMVVQVGVAEVQVAGVDSPEDCHEEEEVGDAEHHDCCCRHTCRHEVGQYCGLSVQYEHALQNPNQMLESKDDSDLNLQIEDSAQHRAAPVRFEEDRDLKLLPHSGKMVEEDQDAHHEAEVEDHYEVQLWDDDFAKEVDHRNQEVRCIEVQN